MNISGNTILVTGGSGGIGLALAERFVKAGNQVIVCGKRPEKLAAAKAKVPQLHARVCDVAVAAERVALCEWVRQEFPNLNVLVNNAGIQNRNGNLLQADAANWGSYQAEIATNVEAPIHLTMLLLPLLVGKPNATIINVSSSLAFTPMASIPIYCATKAAVHSFTMSLRHQVANHGVEVVEVIPPAVQTDLGGAGLHTRGVPLDEYADATFLSLEQGGREIGYGSHLHAGRMSRDEIDAAFERMNNRR